MPDSQGLDVVAPPGEHARHLLQNTWNILHEHGHSVPFNELSSLRYLLAVLVIMNVVSFVGHVSNFPDAMRNVFVEHVHVSSFVVIRDAFFQVGCCFVFCNSFFQVGVLNFGGRKAFDELLFLGLFLHVLNRVHAPLQRNLPCSCHFHDTKLLQYLLQSKALSRISSRAQRDSVVTHVNYLCPENVCCLENLVLFHVTVGLHFDEHQLSLQSLLERHDLDVLDFHQLGDLFRQVLAGIRRRVQNDSEKSFVHVQTHGEGFDVEPSSREHARDAVDNTALVRDEYQNRVFLHTLSERRRVHQVNVPLPVFTFHSSFLLVWPS
mmetsp:Transcript_5463/g.15524  ORF Transcript_5463/g.15524 Transcript_5463/m.15524 type:complete len:321 (-) Transcript_5463:18-980(-)